MKVYTNKRNLNHGYMKLEVWNNVKVMTKIKKIRLII